MCVEEGQETFPKFMCLVSLQISTYLHTTGYHYILNMQLTVEEIFKA